MKPSLFQQIADKLNRDIRTQNGVTAQQVASVANGSDKCYSHPVYQAIRIEFASRKIHVP